MGSELVFKSDGTGKILSWGSVPADEDDEEEVPYEFIDEFVWERINNTSIKIKSTIDKYYEIIEYKLEKHKGPYGVKEYKLYDPNNRLTKDSDIFCFYTIPGELFKYRRNPFF